MKSPILLASAAALALAPLCAKAETTAIDPAALPGKTVYETATLKPLAMSKEGAPLAVLLQIEAGKTVPPHATKSGLRLLTVVQGTLSWGDGDTVDQSREANYPQGSLLILPPGEKHWLAARDGNLLLQLVVLPQDSPVAAVRERMK